MCPLHIGLQRVQLIKSQLPDPELPEDAWKFTMHVDNVKVPAVETTYWCKVKKLPAMKNKHHIIRVCFFLSNSFNNNMV